MSELNREPQPTATAAGIRRLAGVLAYLAGGLCLVLAADNGFEAWQQSVALSQGNTQIRVEQYDDLGEPLGTKVIPVSEERVGQAVRSALLWGVIGVAGLVLGVLAKGAPFRDVASRDSRQSISPPADRGGPV